MIRSVIKYSLLIFPIILLFFAVLLDYGVIIFHHETPNRTLIDDMDNTNPLDDQLFSVLPGNAVSRNADQYHYKMIEFDEAESEYKFSLDTFDLNLGKNRFETFCSHCHGFGGLGDGKIITDVVLSKDEDGFPAPPSLLRYETKTMSDTRLFHIISAGQNIMTSKSHVLNEYERLSIVKYIRFLQNQSM